MIKIKVPNTNFEFTIKKGNKKPIPSYVWIGSMQSSTDCISRKKGLCEIGENCYALIYEQNPIMYKTVICRDKDEECIDYLVNNHMSEFFANELIKRHNNAKTHKMKYLRWNESGDCKSLEHLIFVDEVADILFKEIGAISVIYTHRKDLWEQFKPIRKSKALIVNGSGFMADNNFKAVENFSGNSENCSSNCEMCFNEGYYYCYDINNTGRTIEEILRRKKGVKK